MQGLEIGVISSYNVLVIQLLFIRNTTRKAYHYKYNVYSSNMLME